MSERGLEITITFEDHKHVFRYQELTAVDVRDCRRETGFTVQRMIGIAADAEPDIDSLAAILWLARRQEGERGLRFDAVASRIRPDSDISLDVFLPELLDAEERAAAAGELPDPE